MVACSTQPTSPPAASDPDTDPVDIYSLFSEPTDKVISVRSLSELETMRAMAVSADTAAVEQYLHSVDGGGADTQSDLVNFLKLYDALPKLNLLDGEIIWICLSVSENASIFHIAVKAENGDWVRTDYNLAVTDVDAALDELESSNFAAELLQTPLSAANGKIMLYSQKLGTTTGSPGVTVTWKMTMDEIYGTITYHSDSTESITAAEVFANASVSDR